MFMTQGNAPGRVLAGFVRRTIPVVDRANGGPTWDDSPHRRSDHSVWQSRIASRVAALRQAIALDLASRYARMRPHPLFRRRAVCAACPPLGVLACQLIGT